MLLPKKKHKVPIFNLPESYVGLLRVRISAVWISGYLDFGVSGGSRSGSLAVTESSPELLS